MNTPRKTGFRAKFKIVSTIENNQTLLIDTDTGNTVGLVQKIDWSVSVNDPYPKCVIEMYGVDMDVELNANTEIVPVQKFNTHSEDFAKLLEAIESDSLPDKPVPIKKTAKKTSKKVVKKTTTKKVR